MWFVVRAMVTLGYSSLSEINWIALTVTLWNSPHVFAHCKILILMMFVLPTAKASVCSNCRIIVLSILSLIVSHTGFTLGICLTKKFFDCIYKYINTKHFT